MSGSPTFSAAATDVFAFLGTTAEISITFAGFSSLFFILARRDGSLAPEIAVLIRFILLGSLISLFLAALPLVASGLGLAGASLWRASSCTALATSIGMSVFAARQRRSLIDREVTALARIAWILGPLSGLTSLANIAGWPLAPNGGMHLAAIWLGLAIASMNLVDLVFRWALNDPEA
jgi:hypothetical protein